jgi:hypothetical protein
MVRSDSQLLAVFDADFVGLGGLGDVQFRAPVRPGDRLIIVDSKVPDLEFLDALNTADQAWHELAPFPGRVVQIANRGQTAAVLMKSGEWVLLWPDGSSTGPSLPKRAKMVALASERDRNTLYAIGMPAASSTTEPASEAAATEPAAAPASRLVPAWRAAR